MGRLGLYDLSVEGLVWALVIFVVAVVAIWIIGHLQARAERRENREALSKLVDDVAHGRPTL